MSANETLLALVVSYIMPLALLALLLTSSHLKQWHRGAVLALLPLLYGLHYAGITNLGGWPTDKTLPDRFTLIGQLIVEPDKRNDTAGAITLWVQAEGERVSRLYQLGYDRELHRRLLASEQREQAGHPQVGKRESSGSTPVAGQSRDSVIFEDKKTRPPPAKPD